MGDVNWLSGEYYPVAFLHFGFHIASEENITVGQNMQLFPDVREAFAATTQIKILNADSITGSPPPLGNPIAALSYWVEAFQPGNMTIAWYLKNIE